MKQALLPTCVCERALFLDDDDGLRRLSFSLCHEIRFLSRRRRSFHLLVCHAYMSLPQDPSFRSLSTAPAQILPSGVFAVCFPSLLRHRAFASRARDCAGRRAVRKRRAATEDAVLNAFARAKQTRLFSPTHVIRTNERVLADALPNFRRREAGCDDDDASRIAGPPLNFGELPSSN